MKTYYKYVKLYLHNPGFLVTFHMCDFFARIKQ